MDKVYMARALELAKKGQGKVSPNPMVGAVIVKNGKVIGEGYHKCYGEAHAEINAFNNAIEDTYGACLYVTLEPCFHYGKTPPCVDKVIERGIKRVVIGSLDPNPLVAGKGVKKLIDNGIEVEVGILEAECQEMNKIFMKYIVENKPYIVLKSAMTLDGKIATVTGNSKWITGEAARVEGHKLRNNLKGIMVGVNTVIADDPELTCRIEQGRNPLRIIVDTNLRVPLASKVVSDELRRNTIIATTERADQDKLRLLKNRGVEIVIVDIKEGKVDLNKLLNLLAERNIDSILLEGGAELSYSALKEGIVDEVNIFIAPMIIGGVEAKVAIGGEGIKKLKDAIKIEKLVVDFAGDDIWLKGKVKKR